MYLYKTTNVCTKGPEINPKYLPFIKPEISIKWLKNMHEKGKR